jgi:hypothetical protein
MLTKKRKIVETAVNTLLAKRAKTDQEENNFFSSSLFLKDIIQDVVSLFLISDLAQMITDYFIVPRSAYRTKINYSSFENVSKIISFSTPFSFDEKHDYVKEGEEEYFIRGFENLATFLKTKKEKPCVTTDSFQSNKSYFMRSINTLFNFYESNYYTTITKLIFEKEKEDEKECVENDAKVLNETCANDMELRNLLFSDSFLMHWIRPKKVEFFHFVCLSKDKKINLAGVLDFTLSGDSQVWSIEKDVLFLLPDLEHLEIYQDDELSTEDSLRTIQTENVVSLTLQTIPKIWPTSLKCLSVLRINGHCNNFNNLEHALSFQHLIITTPFYFLGFSIALPRCKHFKTIVLPWTSVNNDKAKITFEQFQRSTNNNTKIWFYGSRGLHNFENKDIQVLNLGCENSSHLLF